MDTIFLVLVGLVVVVFLAAVFVPAIVLILGIFWAGAGTAASVAEKIKDASNKEDK